MNKLTIVFGVVMISLFLAFFDAEKRDAHAGGDKAVFKGVDVTCEQCDKKLEDTLNNLIGIKNFEVDEENETITVWFYPDQTKADWIEKSLESAGLK